MSVDTVARWIRTVMKEAGIDIEKFNAHNAHGASASAASAGSAPLDAILRAGNWSGLSSFSKHYRCQPLQLHVPSCSVANAVLSSFSAS